MLSGRRNTFGSTAATSSVTGAGSRFSAPSHRATTRSNFSSSSPSTGSAYVGASPASRYSSTYSTPSPNRPLSSSGTRYSRLSSTAAGTGDTGGSNFRTSRYDSHYSKYGANRRSSDIGSESRYTSAAGSVSTARPYVTASSGVSTSRESSLSKSWPSPARNLGTSVNLPRYDASVRSSSSTVASTVAARSRRSPLTVGGSVPALPSSNYSGIESRRGSTRSVDLAFNRSPSSSTLHTQISRRYLGSGSAGLDGNFDAGRAESLYRPSTKYTTAGSNRYLTSGISGSKNYDLLDSVGGSSSRRASVLSTSSSVRASSMSRSPIRGPSPSQGLVSKTLWNKHYGALSARWAEQTGATLSSTANGRNQYSYRPTSVRRMSNGAVSDGSVEVSIKRPEPATTTTAPTTATAYTRRTRRKNKEESDGYDSSSSSDGEADKGTKAKDKTASANTLTFKTTTKPKPKRTSAIGGTGTGSFRRTRGSNITGSGTGTSANGVSTAVSSTLARKQDGQPSSSDNETAQDSLDARIKARRKRLQKSKAMLQEHKEDGWNYRRTLQIEESKQRQQTSAAATISYSRTTASEPIKRDEEQPKSDTLPTSSAAKFSAVDEGVERKSAQRTQKTDVIEPSPRATPSKSTVPSAIDENAAGGFRVQKIVLKPLKSNWKGDPAAAAQSDHGGDDSIKCMQPESPQKVQPTQNDQKTQRQANSVSRSPAPNPVNVGVKKLLDEEKAEGTMNYRRSSPLHRASPMSNRGISNERTPPPPISQRQDFNYNQYVNSIAPKQVSYENPAAALVEADQEQQLQDLPKVQPAKTQAAQNGPKQSPPTVEVDAKGGVSKAANADKPSDIKVNIPPADHTKIAIKTKPIRTQPPSVVVVTAVSPPSAKRNVNDGPKASSPATAASSKPPAEMVPSNSLNTIPTPFRRTSGSPSPARTSVEDRPLARLTPSRSNEKLASKSPESIRRQPPLPPQHETTDDDERKRRSSAQQKKVAEANYAVVNGDQHPPNPTKRLPTPERATPTITVPMTMIPAKNVPEKITPTFTPTFTQPSPSQLQHSPNPGHGRSPREVRESSVPKSVSQQELLPPPRGHMSDHSHESTPLSVINNQRSVALAAAKEAEEKLRLELTKHQRREDLRKESLADLHRLPSVDREMLHLLTLGEELNNSRSSLSTLNSQTAGANPTGSQQSISKFAQSFRTAMPQKGMGNPPLPPGPGARERHSQHKRSVDMSGNGSVQGSRESLNSYNLNVAPKPWRPSLQGSREGSSESIASSFATAASTSNMVRDSKDSLNTYPYAGSYKDSLLNVYPKPWSNRLGKDKLLSTSAEPLATVTETPGEHAPVAPPRSHLRHPQSHRNTNSLELATKKVDEMLRLAKLKHRQQQRREKIVLLQSQVQQPHNLTVITMGTPVGDEKGRNPILDASQELDKVYEAIQLDYAEAQESRQRHQKNRHQQQQGSASDNENVFMRPQLVTVFSTVHLPSPRRAESGDETGKRRNHHYRDVSGGHLTDSEKAHMRRRATNAQTMTDANTGGGPYDNSKFDYTKRWLEGDLKSLARDTKPDLLQFGSAPRLDFDQRSVGSASAEVAAITNKDRLQAMRAVPDLVPQHKQQQHHLYQHQQSHRQHHHQQQGKPQLVKPSPVVAAKAPNKSDPNHGKMLAPIVVGNFLGPRVGQPGSKSSSFAGGLPSLQNNGTGSGPVQHPGQRHHGHSQRLQPPQHQVPIHFNSGGIRQAVDHLRASAESLAHSDRSWTVPKKVCAQGHVRKQVDMFDRMSDNDSELSFRSADNVAYRSALYKPSRRLSLTDHMANFVRRFESDEESTGGGGSGFYRRVNQSKQPHGDLHSDDEVRLAVLRNTNPNPPYYKRPLGNAPASAANGSGSTQSLPVAMPYHHQQKMPNGNLFPGAPPAHFLQAAPHFQNAFGQQQGGARSVGYLGSRSQEQMTPQQPHRKVIPPWLRQQNRATPPKQQYWSSNSTLTDLEAPGVSQYYPSHSSKYMHSNDNMQAVDSLVAELELNTDASGSVISQRSTSNFPVDRFYYSNNYHQTMAPMEIDRSSSRSKLNAIPEQAEQQHQQNPMETLQIAQKRLEEARRDLKNVAAVGARRQMAKDKPHGLLAVQDSLLANKSSRESNQEKHASQQHYGSSSLGPKRQNDPSSSSLPRSVDGRERRGRPVNQHQDPQMVTYRQSKSVVGRPASYAAPGAAAGQGTSGHSFAPAGSAEQLGNRKHALGRDKEEDNYDNVLIGGWQRVPSQRSKAPEPPRSAIPSSHLNSPSVIKIGSIVLGRSGTPTNEQQPNEMTQSKIEKQQQQQQQGMRNPLRNFFQFFNKTNSGSKPTEGETSNEHYPQRSPSSSSQQKAPSTLSLNVGPSAEPSGTLPRTGNSMTGSMVVTSDGNHFHKSCSTNDAYTLKPSLTAQEMKQLDDLLTSFHEDAHATGNAGQKKSDGLRTKADSSTNGGVKPDQGKQAKAGDKSANGQDQRAPSRFRLGIPAFWKKA